MKKDHFCRSAASAAAAVAVFFSIIATPLAAAETVLQDESLTLTDEINVTGSSFMVKGESSIVLAAGSVKTRLWNEITVADGATLTLDLSSFTGSRYMLLTRIVAEGTGKVRVKGDPGKITYGYPGFLDQPISIFDVKDFAFVDGNGVKTDDPLVFSGMSCIVSLPECGVVYREATVAILSEGIVAPGEDGTLVLSETGLNGLLLYNDSALPEGTVVSVPAGCTVYELPTSLDMSSFTYTKLSWRTNSTPIVLSGGTLDLHAVSDHVVTGDITGNGTVVMGATRGRSGDERTWVIGDLSFEGTVSVVGGNSSSSDRISFGTNAVLPALSLDKTSDVYFETPDGEFAASVSVAGLTATSTKCVLHVRAGQTVTIGSLSGRFMKTGAGKVKFAAGTVHCLITDGDTVLYSSTPWSDIGSYDVSGLQAPQGGTAVELGGDVTYTDLAPGVTVTAAEGLDARIFVKPGTVPTVAGGAGTVTLTAGSWRESAALWVDPSSGTGITQPGDLAREEWIEAIGTDPKSVMTREYSGYKLIESIPDCRPGRTFYSLRNARNYYDAAKAEPVWVDFPNTYPFLKTSADGGLSYIDCHVQSSGRRLQIGMGDVVARENNTMKAVTVIMAYSGARGGGQAIIGTSEGAYLRTPDLDSAIVKSAVSGKIRKNGVEVADPTSAETRLDAGWQVLTVDVSAYTLYGFGQNATPASGGGPCYGDILIFTNVLTEAEIADAERYLAEKWGVTYAGDVPEAEARAVGRGGTVNVDSSVPLTLGGDYAGMINVTAGSVLKVADDALPPEAEDIPSEGRVAWFDADRTSSFVYADNPECPTEIISVLGRDRTSETLSEGDMFLWAPKTRGPMTEVSARGFGPERNWIRFDNYRKANTLRFRTYPYQDPTSSANSADYASGAQKVPFRTAFIAMDSSLGGGTPILSDSLYGGTLRARTTGAWTEPIWPRLTSSKVTGGETRLNGLPVNGTVDGFTGGPEVFSFTTTDAIEAFCFGYFEVSNREIEGEIALYDRELTGAERLTVEAYMMHKWCGTLPSGYSDLRKATVTGGGTVETAAAKRPLVDSAFSGVMRFTDSTPATLSMEVGPDAGVVTGALDAPSAKLSASVPCAIDVSFPSCPDVGTYTLVDVADSAVAWTVNIPKISKRYVKVTVTPCRVTLTVEPTGLSVIVR